MGMPAFGAADLKPDMNLANGQSIGCLGHCLDAEAKATSKAESEGKRLLWLGCNEFRPKLTSYSRAHPPTHTLWFKAPNSCISEVKWKSRARGPYMRYLISCCFLGTNMPPFKRGSSFAGWKLNLIIRSMWIIPIPVIRLGFALITQEWEFVLGFQLYPRINLLYLP